MRKLFRYLYYAVSAVTLTLISYGLVAYALSLGFSEYRNELPAFGSATGQGGPGSPDTPVSFAPDHPGCLRILSVNGGALSGLTDLAILSAIEERSGKPAHELFDFFAGSSTGAIVSTLLLLPQSSTGEPMSATEAITVYETFSKEVLSTSFSHNLRTAFGVFGPAYDNAGRIEVAEKLFDEKTFGELLRPAMFPAFAHDDERIAFFSNWKEQDSALLLSSLLPAVTAAPAIFPFIALQGYANGAPIFGDAGLVLNAPGALAYQEARIQAPSAEHVVVVTVDARTPFKIPLETVARGGLFQWFSLLWEVVLIGEAEVSQRLLAAEAASSRRDGSLTTFELIAHVDQDVNVFVPDPENIRILLEAGRDFVANNGAEIDAVVSALSPPAAGQGSCAKSG